MHGYPGPLSFLGEEEEAVACQVREGEEAVRHPSPVEAVGVVGEPCPDRRAVEAVVVEVAFRVREEVVGVHQTLQVVGEEEAAEVVVGARFGVAAEAGVVVEGEGEGEVAVQERWPAASGRMW